MEIIYCAGNNPAFEQIAHNAGFLLGCRLPDNTLHNWNLLHFVDQNWKKPNRQKYMRLLAEYRPHMATVLDWEQESQFEEVIDWAEEAAQYVNVVLIIPKVHHSIARIPKKTISGKEIRIAYSVPTSHGGSELMIWEFANRSVHLLGGSPGQQMRLMHYLDVKSVDGNMMSKMAQSCLFWTKGKSRWANRWQSLKMVDGQRFDGHGPREAFRRSCENIMNAMIAWRSRT